jgi:DNA recombination protein RmuC
MEWVALAIGLGLGAGGGWLIGWALGGKKAAAGEEAVRRLEDREKMLGDDLSAARDGLAAADRRATELAATLEAERLRLTEQKKMLDESQQRLAEVFAKISQESLQHNTDTFLKLAGAKFKPFEDLLHQQGEAVKMLEEKRSKAYGSFEELSKQILQSNLTLGEQTAKLETVLRRPDHRGKWGEIGLRNIVEIAGMTEHCDFEEQPVADGDSSLRPDMVIRMPGGGRIIVDSKVPLEHYLEAAGSSGDVSEQLEQHAVQVERHVTALSSKEYWKAFDNTPAFVVMFVRVESALVAALDRKPDLHERALKNHVLLTSPVTLLALLQAAAYGWRQESVAENAREIARVGQELFDRLVIFRNHMDKAGQRLHQAVESYNSAVGSFGSRLEPAARRLSELHSTGGEELSSVEMVDIQTRQLEGNSE